MNCEVHQIKYDAMEPTIEFDSRVLADLRRCERVSEGLYLVETDGQRFLRRARAQPDHQWMLVCDNPEWEDIPWPDDVRIVGRVVWTTKMLAPKVDVLVTG